MAQVTIYLSDDLELRAREAAGKKNNSLGRWIAEQVSEKLKNEWPAEVLAALGSFPDFPNPKNLRQGMVRMPSESSWIDSAGYEYDHPLPEGPGASDQPIP